MVKIPTQCINFFLYINVTKFAISVWQFSPHCVVKFTTVYSTNYKTVWKSIVWELLPYSVYRILPHSSKKKCGKNPQSARRKRNYHTKCDKNCHKILSVYKRNTKQLVLDIYQLPILPIISFRFLQVFISLIFWYFPRRFKIFHNLFSLER